MAGRVEAQGVGAAEEARIRHEFLSTGEVTKAVVVAGTDAGIAPVKPHGVLPRGLM